MVNPYLKELEKPKDVDVILEEGTNDIMEAAEQTKDDKVDIPE